MELIIGGAWQGKHAYARDRYGELPPDWLLDGLHLWVRDRLEQGTDPLPAFAQLLDSGDYTAILCEDIFCGVVPTDPQERRWREETGRCLTLAANRATQVTRLFCGIATPIKIINKEMDRKV